MRLLLILILVLLGFFSCAYGGNLEVRTGYGYIKDNGGKIVCKYDLPKGVHPLRDGYTYVEVATKDDLKDIKVYQEPIREKTLDEKLEAIGLTKEDLKEVIK
jgi:hypothetical protein